jgi:RimJ/RimL family protein N-acetyltransferase
MFRGTLVGLRARQPEDVPLLHRDLYDDIPTRVQADARPWRPLPVDSSPYRTTTSDDADIFSVVELSSGELAGEALLWQIDTHNRSSHLGLAIRPEFRGRGIGDDTLRTLCEYGFRIRGLHRLQLETAGSNDAMIRAATRVGFRHEGQLAEALWVAGRFCDEVIFGLLADDYAAHSST